ncbi:unnamed protein product [Brassica oleracea var. botrytis]
MSMLILLRSIPWLVNFKLFILRLIDIIFVLNWGSVLFHVCKHMKLMFIF